MSDVHELFEKHNDEFLKFERIAEKRHPRADLCAMLYLHERFGGTGDAVSNADHDEIWLDWDGKDCTEEDVIYLVRCGVRHHDDMGLCMFV